MPSQILPDDRGVLASVFDPGAWHELLGNVSDVVGDVATVWQQIEDIQGSKPLTPPPSPPPTIPPYQSNLTLGDLKFTPNVTLVIVGGALLVVALILRR